VRDKPRRSRYRTGAAGSIAMLGSRFFEFAHHISRHFLHWLCGPATRVHPRDGRNRLGLALRSAAQWGRIRKGEHAQTAGTARAAWRMGL